jgi:hypothetical protein
VSAVSKSKQNKARRARATAAKQRERLAQRDVRGRVHLALIRDPVSGQEGVALVAPVFGEQWQNDVAIGAANTTHGVLRGAPTH